MENASCGEREQGDMREIAEGGQSIKIIMKYHIRNPVTWKDNMKIKQTI